MSNAKSKHANVTLFMFILINIDTQIAIKDKFNSYYKNNCRAIYNKSVQIKTTSQIYQNN